MDPIDDVRFYTLIRSRLEHEDNLVVHRLSWLMASQAFLFTAYAISASGLATAAGAGYGPLQGMFRLMPVVGLISTVLIWMGMVAALRAMAWLRSLYSARIKDEAALGVPPALSPHEFRMWGLAAPRFLPAIFVVAWLILLVFALR